MTPLSRGEILSTGRLFALRAAIVAAFAALMPEVDVRTHPGRLDMGDVLEKGVFVAPCVAVAVSRAKDAARLSRGDDLVAEITAYVVAEDLMVGGLRVERDEFALALCETILRALADDDFAHFARDAGPPEEAEATPVFTMKSFEHGAVYYAVTWRCTLYAVADPAFETVLS